MSHTLLEAPPRAFEAAPHPTTTVGAAVLSAPAPQAHPARSADAAEPLFLADPSPVGIDDPVVAAVDRQAAAARAALRAVDPQAWLFAERTRYLSEGTCDPYAELMLRRGGFLTTH